MGKILLFSVVIWITRVNGYYSANIRLKRVRDGDETVPHSSPWLGYLSIGGSVFLVNSKEDAFKFDSRNGASDIAMTVAHAIVRDKSFRSGSYYDPQIPYTVSFGKHDINIENETNQIDVKIVKAIIHKKYETWYKQYDIALLKLEKPIPFNEFVKPITLSRSSLQDVNDCFVTGWGQTLALKTKRYNKSEIADYGIHYMTPHSYWTSFGPSVAPGDSGSPLVCSLGDQHVAQGIVSAEAGTEFSFTNIRNLSEDILLMYDEINDMHIYNRDIVPYRFLKPMNESMITQLLTYYVSGVYGYVPIQYETLLDIEVDHIKSEDRWLDPSFAKSFEVVHSQFYPRDIIGYIITDDANTCAVMCFEYNGAGLCSYVLSIRKCFFSVETNYSESATVNMPFQQSLTIRVVNQENRATDKPYTKPMITPVPSVLPDIDTFTAPLWTVSVELDKCPMFHCSGQMWRYNQRSQNSILYSGQKNPGCIMKLAPQSENGVVMSSFTIIKDFQVYKYARRIKRVTNSKSTDYQSRVFNYTVDEYPTFRRHNPFLESFIAEPNTMPWLVALSDERRQHCSGVLLNESDMVSIGRNDKTRFILTTCRCVQKWQPNSTITVLAGSFFKDLNGHFSQVQTTQNYIQHPICGQPMGVYDSNDRPIIYMLKGDIVFNENIQPLSIAADRLPTMSFDMVFAALYDKGMMYTPRSLIPFETGDIYEEKNGESDKHPPWIIAYRKFAKLWYRKEEIHGSPLVACNRSTVKCFLMGFWIGDRYVQRSDGYLRVLSHFFVIYQYINWIRSVLMNNTITEN